MQEICYLAPACAESHEALFVRGHHKKGVHHLGGRKYSHKKLPEKFSGKFGEIRAKNLSHHSKFTCSYTHSDEVDFNLLLSLLQHNKTCKKRNKT